MNLNVKPAYTFDDVLLVPGSSLASRKLADPSVNLSKAPYLDLKIPIISANMNSITEVKMAIAMNKAGGLGILHRYASRKKVVEWITELVNHNVPAIPSIGVHPSTLDINSYWDAGARIICLDIANGYSQAAFDTVMDLKKLGWIVIAGNVATVMGARYLAEAGADIIKVGIGPGSVCTTRIVTGHGYPQLSAIMNISSYLETNGYRKVKIIADGGIKSSGDIVKALAAGADAVMSGRLFAGCEETPNPRIYQGMASNEARKTGLRNDLRVTLSDAPEGVEIGIPLWRVKKVDEVMKELEAGIKSGMSYSGATTLQELRELAEFVVITPNGLKENGVHAD